MDTKFLLFSVQQAPERFNYYFDENRNPSKQPSFCEQQERTSHICKTQRRHVETDIEVLTQKRARANGSCGCLFTQHTSIVSYAIVHILSLLTATAQGPKSSEPSNSPTVAQKSSPCSTQPRLQSHLDQKKASLESKQHSTEIMSFRNSKSINHTQRAERESESFELLLLWQTTSNKEIKETTTSNNSN